MADDKPTNDLPLELDGNLIEFSGQSRARSVSLRTVLRAIVESRSISRAELSRKTGFSKQTTSEVVRELMADGWIREAGQTRGAVGRSAINYELNSRKGYVIGADLGGTKLWIAIADINGSVIAETRVATDKRGGEHVLDQLRDEVGNLVSGTDISFDSILCAALGVPGAYDRSSDTLRLTSNIRGLDGKGFVATLQKRLPFPFYVENDVTMAAKGELWRGKGKTLDTFAFLAMGTGAGLGIVSEKQLLRGARGGAGEIAWLPVGGDPFDSRNFHAGTLESAVGSAALVQRYRGLGGTDATTVAEIFDQMEAGEAIAIAVVDETARVLAQGVLAICSILDPQILIMGGSVGTRIELVDRIRELLPRCMPHPVRIEVSTLGSRAALIGAVGMAIDRVHEILLET